MRSRLLILFILLSTFCRAQAGAGKTAVFKVRAPKTECAILSEENFFWLEKDNIVRIKVKGKNKKVQLSVTAASCQTVQQDEQTYTLRFSTPGIAEVSVFELTGYGRLLLCTKKYEVKGPALFFCGVKMDSTSYRIDLRSAHLYAYSDFFRQVMPIVSFEMFFTEDTTKLARNRPESKPVRMKSDTCQLTAEMRKRLLKFQPKYNFIYMHSIICEVPDGTKRILDPIRLHVVQDTIDKNELRLRYEVRKLDFN